MNSGKRLCAAIATLALLAAYGPPSLRSLRELSLRGL
jgi:hypothetical protein